MFRQVAKITTIGVATKFIYDAGYEAGKSHRNSFFSDVEKTCLKKIETQLPPEHRAEFRRDVNKLKHDIHHAKNEVRRGLGMSPR